MSESLQILFIDGKDEDREYYVQHLKISSPDCVIFEAETGRRGLELYRSYSIDCVILELELPDMSGLEVLITLTQSLRQPEIPVIILTRSNFLSLMELAILNGAYISLHKQIAGADHLEIAIRQAVATRQPDRNRGTLASPLCGLKLSA
jgi:CheY-like chemotaxis protein